MNVNMLVTIVLMVISLGLFFCVCACIYGPTIMYHHNLRKLRKGLKKYYQEKYNKDFEEYMKKYDEDQKNKLDINH